MAICIPSYPRCSCTNTQHQTRKLEYACVSTCNEEKITYTTIIVWKWNFIFYLKSNLIYTWHFKCWKKNEECPHLLQDKLVVLTHWYSKELFFHLKQLASFELRIRIFNFYQCTRGNLIFLDILWNITSQKRALLNSICFEHFQTLASFSCKAQ